MKWPARLVENFGPYFYIGRGQLIAIGGPSSAKSGSQVPILNTDEQCFGQLHGMVMACWGETAFMRLMRFNDGNSVTPKCQGLVFVYF